MEKREEFYYPSSDGVTKIHAVAWKPEGEVKAVYQMVHGMVEFIERYDEFANFLTQHGFYVVGHDHLGHGKSIISQEDWGYFAKENSVDCVIQDIYALMAITKEKYPNVPYVIMGHSMGSFFIRRFACQYGDKVDAVIVMGTGNQPKVLQCAGTALTKVIKLFYGERHRSKLLSKAMFGGFNKRIVNPVTCNDWLSKDAKIVEAYQNEPANQFLFTMNGMETLLSVIGYVTKKSNVIQTPKNLPMLFVAGEADPVGEYSEAVKRAFAMYQDVGMQDVSIKLFPDDRHEILNETDRLEVFEYILDWVMHKIQMA